MLKKLYEDHFLEIEPLLTKEQKRLKLSPNELAILKTLFQSYKKRIFSMAALVKKVELTEAEIGQTIDKLESKGFIAFSLEKKDSKEIEVFDLSGTFSKITTLYNIDLKDQNDKKNETFIGQTISKIENILNRTLSSFELEMIRSWYDLNAYTHQTIISKIEEHKDSGRFSVKFIERTLNQSKSKTSIAIDDQADKAIDEIFKAIK